MKQFDGTTWKDSSKSYVDSLVGNFVSTTATKEQLVFNATLPGMVQSEGYNLKPSANSNFTVFTAPFPMKIQSVSLMQNIQNLPKDTTNYMAVTWRKVSTSGVLSTVANKRTNESSWEGQIPWSFDNEIQTEENKTLNAGESLNFAFSIAGKGFYVFPIFVTVRYTPL